MPGIGNYSQHRKLESAGSVTMTYSGSLSSAEFVSKRYFVLVRRGTGEKTPLSVDASVSIEGSAGCGGSNPDPPELRTETLK